MVGTDHSEVLEVRGQKVALWWVGLSPKGEDNGISRAGWTFQKAGVWHRRIKNAIFHEKSVVAMVLTPANNPNSF